MDKVNQDMKVTFRDGTTEVFSDIMGYQLGGTVIQILMENGNCIIYPMVDIKNVLVIVKE